MSLISVVAGVAGVVVAAQAQGAIIYASGQFREGTGPFENRFYEIDTTTGAATPISGLVTGAPAGLAGTSDQRLLGHAGGQLSEVNPFTGALTPIGAPSGVTATGFDILEDGRGYITPLAGGASRQAAHVDISTGVVTPIGAPNAIGDAIDAAFGLAPGTSTPFVISLGSVGGTVYGVSLESGRTNLIAINPDTGAASVIGAPNAVGADARYGGFAAMTGVDENGDGMFDALFGGVNSFDDDNDPGTPSIRFGGVVRYDLVAGTFSVVGSNPGVIFFGFGSSPVPAPGAGVAALVLGVCALRRRR